MKLKKRLNIFVCVLVAVTAVLTFFKFIYKVNQEAEVFLWGFSVGSLLWVLTILFIVKGITKKMLETEDEQETLPPSTESPTQLGRWDPTEEEESLEPPAVEPRNAVDASVGRCGCGKPFGHDGPCEEEKAPWNPRGHVDGEGLATGGEPS